MIEEDRALYDIEEQTVQSCTGGTITGRSGVAGDIGFSGGFERGACADVTFTLGLSAENGKVRFVIESDDPRFNQVSLALAVPPDVQFYGFGEQTALALRGHNIPIIVQEQGVGRGGSVSQLIGAARLLPLPPEQKALLAILVNAQGNAFTTYYPVPQTITGTGAGLLLENTGYTRFDLTADDHIEIHAFAGKLVGRLYGSDDLLTTVTQTTEYTGRMPALPEWTQQGAIIGMQGGTAEVRQNYQTLKAAGVPVAGLWLQDWVGVRSTLGGSATQLWWNWELDPERYPGWDQLRQDLAADGVRLLGYFNPYLVDVTGKDNYDRNLSREAKAAGYLVKNQCCPTARTRRSGTTVGRCFGHG